MMKNAPSLRTFFPSPSLPSLSLNINGIGIREPMFPFMIDRPVGTGDYLIMQFHHRTLIGFNNGQDCFEGGAIIIWPPDVRQKYGYPDESIKKWTHSWIHLDGKLLARYIHEADLPTDEPFTAVRPKMFDDCLYRIYWEITDNLHADEIIVSNLVQSMLHEVARDYHLAVTSQPIPEGILRARNHIEQFSNQNLTLEQLADISGYSIPHLCVLFKEYFGVSPIAYSTQIRMQQAIYLLQDRNRKITDIADELGYRDVYHFSKRFKEYFGRCPSSFCTSLD